jgi:hypothetical protein
VEKYYTLLGLLLFLNAFDAYATVIAVTYMGAIEVNPLMAALLNIHPLVFLLVKLYGVAIPWLWLCMLVKHRIVQISVWLLTTMYSLLGLWHIYNYARYWT